MKYEETPEYVAGKTVPAKNMDNIEICGYSNMQDRTENIKIGDEVIFSPCTSPIGCEVCGYHLQCPVCKKITGVVETIEGHKTIVYQCGHR